MFRKLPKIVSSICLLACSYSYADVQQPIRIGVLAFTEPEKVEQRWRPTIEKLELDLQRSFELVALPPSELEHDVSLGKFDFLITNALTAVSYKKDYGTSSILTLIPLNNSNPTEAVGSALISRQGTQISSFNDLRFLNAVSSDPNAFGGFQIYAGEMAQNGLNPFKDFNSLKFAGFPQQKLLQQVLDGTADIAILPTCVLENAIAAGNIPKDSLQVVLSQPNSGFKCQSSSQLYPYYSLSKLGKTDHQLATKVIRSLLSIEPASNAAITGRYQAWSATVNDSEVFKLLKQLQQWPFVTNWTSIFKSALPVGIAITLILLLGFIHHLRVKRLVVLRTRDLQAEIAQHKQTEQALLEQTKQFYRAQRVLLTGEMASGIAHELNQPLAGIRYLTQGCIYRLSDNQTELKEAMTKALQQVDRAQSTIKRFRYFCQQPSVMTLCSLNQILDETLSLMSAEFQRMNLTPVLTTEVIQLTADASLLQQVFVNIIRNALDAMENCTEPSLAITLKMKHNQVHINFTDSGSGLSEAALERLFFPFETSKEHGLGLGMIICKRIIEEHHGEIKAMNNIQPQVMTENTQSAGLTISIVLPLKEQTHE
ncbi:PhnD/SsuA/transferrin family substrate-binding protein [Shewanella sp. 10N.261.52.F9]|uniref:sensor histidine kinase n=1 Tax=Shewanella sp. 10N.261.52.F9 TaxID=3229684 RepID=UPI00354BE5BA